MTTRTILPPLLPNFTPETLRRFVNNMLGGKLNIGYDVALTADSGTIDIPNSAASPNSIISVCPPSLGFVYAITNRTNKQFTLEWQGAGSDGVTVSYTVVG
jgi:hypothetical protein